MTNAARVWVISLLLIGCGGEVDSALQPPSGNDTLPPAGGYDAEGRWREASDDLALRTPSAFTVWVGIVELGVSNVFVPPSEDPWITFKPERLTLVLGLDDRGTAIGGSLTLGTASPPPPPTDPEDWYPPGLTVPTPVPRIWPGFQYPLRSLLSSGRRLTFSIAPGDVFTAWCALQTSHPVDDPPGHACFAGPAPAPAELSSASPRAVMCRGPEPACTCDAGGCREDAAFRMPLEIEVDGDRAMGRVIGRAGLWDLSLVRVDQITLPPRK